MEDLTQRLDCAAACFDGVLEAAANVVDAECIPKPYTLYQQQYNVGYKNLAMSIRALKAQGASISARPKMHVLGEMRENGVVWFDQNPHAYPLGTKFYADKELS